MGLASDLLQFVWPDRDHNCEYDAKARRWATPVDWQANP